MYNYIVTINFRSKDSVSTMYDLSTMSYLLLQQETVVVHSYYNNFVFTSLGVDFNSEHSDIVAIFVSISCNKTP